MSNTKKSHQDLIREGKAFIELDGYELRKSKKGEFYFVLFDLNLYVPILHSDTTIHWKIANLLCCRKNGRLLIRLPKLTVNKRDTSYAFKPVTIDSYTYTLITKEIETKIGHKLLNWEDKNAKINKYSKLRKRFETPEEAIKALESTTYTEPSGPQYRASISIDSTDPEKRQVEILI